MLRAIWVFGIVLWIVGIGLYFTFFPYTLTFWAGLAMTIIWFAAIYAVNWYRNLGK